MRVFQIGKSESAEYSRCVLYSKANLACPCILKEDKINTRNCKRDMKSPVLATRYMTGATAATDCCNSCERPAFQFLQHPGRNRNNFSFLLHKQTKNLTFSTPLGGQVETFFFLGKKICTFLGSSCSVFPLNSPPPHTTHKLSRARAHESNKYFRTNKASTLALVKQARCAERHQQ
jgi:hypothetical protein